MDILFISSLLPYPPDFGPRIRTFSFLRRLAERHRVTVLSFCCGAAETGAVEALGAHGVEVHVVPRNPGYSPWKLLRGLVGPTAFSVLSYQSRGMADLVRSVASQRRFDIVQVESIHMAQYCDGFACPTVLDLHNIESLLMRRYAEHEPHPLKHAYAHATWKKLAHYERSVYDRFSHCLTCSEPERELVSHWTGRERVTVIPNGVDEQPWRPDDPVAQPEDRLLFVGRMDYHANVDAVRWFCREIFPSIRARRPHAVLQIVGGYPVREVRQLAKPKEIEVTGLVDDVRPFLRAAAVVVVPLRVGSGTRYKILEALGMGKAVVSTAIGCEGLAVVPGHELLVADRASEFADHVIALLNNADLRANLGSAGRRLVEDRYMWPRIVQRLEQVYENLRAQHQARVSPRLRFSGRHAMSEK